MALDMANSDASCAAVGVLVSFYLVASVNTSSSSAKTSAIHKEKIIVSLSGDKHSDLFNFVKHLKTFTESAEIAKSKVLRGSTEVTIAILCSFIILRYTKLFPFLQEPLKYTCKFKILIQRGNLHLTYISCCRNYTFNVFFWERNTGFEIVMKKVWDAGLS